MRPFAAGFTKSISAATSSNIGGRIMRLPITGRLLSRMAPNATSERDEPASLSVPPSLPPDSSTTPDGQHNSFYRSGGTLSADEPSYVVREADEQLLQGLREGLFCYMLTSRQMGKSSLMNRVAAQLQQEGIAVAQIDLTTIGQNLTIEQWYDGLVYELGRRLKIRKQVNQCWADHAELGPLHRFMAVLREGVLNAIPGNVVIFVDEIDLVRSLPFSTDEFFAAIRECYNRRSSDPEMNRLTFCLLGMATPQDLIRDPRITPFNIGRRIELRDFTLREALQLAQGVQTDGRDGVRLLSRIIYWTNGHPYITQKVCEAVAVNTAIRDENGVDQLCSKLFLSQQARETEANLVPVREYILRSKEERVPALELYQKVRRGAKIIFDNTDPVANLLQLSGITRVQAGRLVVRNRIYEQVFDIPWVMSELPEAEVRRQRALVRQGRLQIAAIAIPILVVVAALAGEAYRQARLAQASALQMERALYISDMRLIGDSLNNDNASDALDLLRKHQHDPMVAFDYKYLLYQCHLANVVCTGHNAPMNDVAFHPLCQSFVSCGNDATIRFWNIVTGEEFASIPTGLSCTSITISQNGRWIAVSGKLNSTQDAVRIYDFASHRNLGTFVFNYHNAILASFSSDSRCLGIGHSGGVTLIDTSNWSKVKSFGVGRQITAMKFSPSDPTLFAYALDTGEVIVENIGNEIKVARYKGIGKLILALAFSKDGKFLAGGAQGGLAAIWNTKTGLQVQTIYNHGHDIFSVRFAPTTEDLITAGSDATIKYWDIRTGQLTFAIHGHTGKIQGMDISSDGQSLATASWDRTAMLWSTSLRTRDVMPIENAQIVNWAPTISMNGLMAAGLTANNQIGVWNTTSGKPICYIPFSGPPPLLGFVPNQNEFVIANDASLEFRSTVTGEPVHRPWVSSVTIRVFALSPDGERIAVVPNGTDLPFVKRLDGGQSIPFALAGKNTWASIAFSANDRYVALGGDDGAIAICDSRTGALITSFPSGLRGSVSSIAFSPDGRALAAASQYASVKVWNLADLHDDVGASEYEVLTLTSPRGKLRALAFSDHSTKLVALTDDGSAITWRASRDE